MDPLREENEMLTLGFEQSNNGKLVNSMANSNSRPLRRLLRRLRLLLPLYPLLLLLLRLQLREVVVLRVGVVVSKYVVI